ncbi:MAG: hypothetical protein JNK48_13315 [Bryobacterales bacterium]|nr:hypothetical protein [Bryobacterales bacterium]
MSEQVQAILQAVRGLTPAQLAELRIALTALEPLAESEPDKRLLVHSIQGKYRRVPTSSESFLRRKQEDLKLESMP